MSFTETLTGGLIADAPDYASMAKKSEAKRKGVINLGLQQINALFGGGSAPFYSLANANDAKFSAKNTYFSQNKKGQFTPYWAPKGARPSGQWNPNAIGTVLNTGGGDLAASYVMKDLGLSRALGFGDEDSPREIAAKKFRRGQLFNAPEMLTFEGFSPGFYEKRAKAYEDFALPQLAEQYMQARDAQQFGLSSRGLLKSTVADKAKSNLERTTGSARQQIADEALNQANQTKQQVESARQNAISQLYQTADPAQAMMSAISQAQQFRTPSTFTPIANMMGGLAQQFYINQLLNNYRQVGAADGGRDFGSYLAPLPK